MSILLTGKKINGTTVIIAEPLPHNMPSTGYCTWYNCTRKSEHDGFCFQHKQYSNVPVAAKVLYEIPKISERRKRELPIYKRIVALKIEEADGHCQLKLPGCTIYAQGGDHKAKRSPNNYIDPKNIIAACNHCNFQKELQVELAKKKGLSISKFEKTIK